MNAPVPTGAGQAGPPALRAVPSGIKRMCARGMAMAVPQCRFDRAVFLLGHMRCGSTALSRVLCAHPQVSGYGEAHVEYRSRAALGQLVLNQWRRGVWKPGARYLHDKILHDRLDSGAPASFAGARAIFLVRRPEAAIRSIRHLFSAIGSAEFASDTAAADYYGARLARLDELWHAFAPDRRLGLDFAELTADPTAALARASRLLALAEPLANGYDARPLPSLGAGDPLAAQRFSGIMPARVATSLAAEPRELELPPGRVTTLDDQYRALITLFSRDPSAA